jgi:excisionase family DNA binding protein
MVKNNPDLLSSKEAAAMAGVSISTIYRWFDQGRIEGRQYPSGTYRFYRSSLMDLLVKSTPLPRKNRRQ